MKKILQIEGMSCSHCVKHVKEALEELVEVQSVVVSLEEGNAVIELNQEIEESVLKEQIEEAGYELKGIQA